VENTLQIRISFSLLIGVHSPFSGYGTDKSRPFVCFNALLRLYVIVAERDATREHAGFMGSINFLQEFEFQSLYHTVLTAEKSAGLTVETPPTFLG
jgi:hypothetical protein